MQFDLFEKPIRFETHADYIAAMMSLTDDPLAQFGGNMVIYRGNPNADLMIIGEGPGAEEDRLGKPYVGRSGQLLDKILESVNFDPENEIYVTNTVFRRPPNNRDPLPAELEYYAPYLMEGIRLVDPKVILLTGRFSMRVVLNERQGITKVRGTWYQREGRWIMPMFHPAYLLRNPQRTPGSPKALTWQDIQAVRRKYDELIG
ncbi:MAG: uracil-DNA glycosylase [Anaerolineae bacterium]|nr:uracil-DNA glycosylase [Anaerolineae bacterium]MCO5196851.1 uracil-DNA glycosylase [Anaerolineae bacterium]